MAERFAIPVLTLLDPTPEVARLLNRSKLELIIPHPPGTEERGIRDSYEHENFILDLNPVS